MKEAGIIIQARLGSSRFPNKMFGEISGKKLIDIVIDECKKTGLNVVLASPSIKLLEYASKKVLVFQGSENDVIKRFHDCARTFKIDPIIRVCGDAKNIHHDLITQQLQNYKKYHHTVYGNYCEIFSFSELEHYYLYDKRPQTREHVTQGMIEDLTVDYEIDLI